VQIVCTFLKVFRFSKEIKQTQYSNQNKSKQKNSMTRKHQVHNLIVLDESGSMSPIKNYIIQGFNELVQTIQGIEKKFPEQEHFISLVSFNGMNVKKLHELDPAKTLQEIDETKYRPYGSTPLFDAMGSGIAIVENGLREVKDYNVLVTILTDGEENASKEFTGAAIKKKVEELKKNNWTFTYIGTDHDIEKMARSLSIENTLNFSKDSAGINEMFEKERIARFKYSEKIDKNEDTSTSFFC
jgi:uncharacterized protein YegL